MFMRACVCALAALLTVAAPAAADFYKGKTITLLVNYGAGGNVDTEARIFARHLPKHFPGKPNVIVQNLAGAGGMTAINMLGLNVSSQADGMTVGFFTMNGVAPLIDDPALKVQYHEFAMIGGLEGSNVTLARTDIVPDFKTSADIAKAKLVYAGGYSKGSTHDIRMALALELLEVNYKLITGFPSVGAIAKALEQKEIAFTTSSMPGYRSQLVPNLIEKGIARPLWHYPTIAKDGAYVANPMLEKEGIPVFTKVYAEAKGKEPDSAKYHALVLVNDIATTLQRGVMVPKATPPEAVAELRKAYEALRSDRDFAAEYENIIKEPAALVSAANAEAALARLRDVRPEIKQVLKTVVGMD